MNRSVERERLATTVPVYAGEVVVAKELVHPVRGSVRCAAAAIVGGALRRRGFLVRYCEVLPCSTNMGRGRSIVQATTWLDRAGKARGFGAATAGDDLVAASAVAEVMREWSSALRTRRLLLAGTRPSCQGARRAVRIAERALNDGPVALWGWTTAERSAVHRLRQLGATVVTDLNLVPTGSTVVFPAHGVEPTVRAETTTRELRTLDATCPLVAGTLVEIRRFLSLGDTVVVIGRVDHAVTKTLTGDATENSRLIQSTDDVLCLNVENPDRVSYVVAPGFPVEEAADVIAALRRRYPGVRAQHPDGLCFAASDRAGAVDSLAVGSDVLLVAASKGCNDAKRLVKRVRAVGHANVYVVERVEDIRLTWLSDAACVGVTAAMSATPRIVNDIVMAMTALGPLSVAHRKFSTNLVSSAGSSTVSPSTAPYIHKSEIPSPRLTRMGTPQDRPVAARSADT